MISAGRLLAGDRRRGARRARARSRLRSVPTRLGCGRASVLAMGGRDTFRKARCRGSSVRGSRRVRKRAFARARMDATIPPPMGSMPRVPARLARVPPTLRASRGAAGRPDRRRARRGARCARRVPAGSTSTGCRRRFDVLATPLVSPRAGDRDARGAGRGAVAATCSRALGFRGNEQDYYDPKNSLLARRARAPPRHPHHARHRLLRGRAAGRRVRRAGVGVPGALPRAPRLARRDSRAALFVDPFFGGRVASTRPRACRRCCARALADAEAHGRRAPRAGLPRADPCPHADEPEGDSPAARRPRARPPRARPHLSLTPDSTGALSERGLLAMKPRRDEAARADLARLLELDPGARRGSPPRATRQAREESPVAQLTGCQS